MKLTGKDKTTLLNIIKSWRRFKTIQRGISLEQGDDQRAAQIDQEMAESDMIETKITADSVPNKEA